MRLSQFSNLSRLWFPTTYPATTLSRAFTYEICKRNVHSSASNELSSQIMKKLVQDKLYKVWNEPILWEKIGPTRFITNLQDGVIGELYPGTGEEAGAELFLIDSGNNIQLAFQVIHELWLDNWIIASPAISSSN